MILSTPRLVLRELLVEDLPAVRAILQDARTMVAYEGAFDEQMVQAWLQRMRDRYRDDGIGLWAVVLRDTGDMIGQCGLTRQHILGADVVEVGYLFNRAHWHRGYATEAATACREYAFRTLGVDRVFAQVRDTNLASMNVAIRLGMTVRGRFVKHYRGVDMPHLVFAVDAPSSRTDSDTHRLALWPNALHHGDVSNEPHIHEKKPSVLFVCVHNAGRSQMAAGWLRTLAGDRIEVRSAGSMPAEQINPVAVQAMHEAGIDIAAQQPKILTTAAVQDSDVVITMGCGDACPIFPGKRYEDWKLEDPAGQGLESVRLIRDEIRSRIDRLVAELLDSEVGDPA